jgi:hypothetical protein
MGQHLPGLCVGIGLTFNTAKGKKEGREGGREEGKEEERMDEREGEKNICTKTGRGRV